MTLSCEVTRFYLGTHHPDWLRKTDVPLFVSRRSLASIKELPRAQGPWALDSGGFTELQQYGEWTISPRQYVEEVRRFRDEIGNLQWAAAQDWMCEPIVREGGVVNGIRFQGTRLTVREHQVRTVENYLRLLDLDPDLPWVPVVQGWSSHGDHLRCVDLYDQYGVSLHTLPLVGVGTVCRRQDTHSGDRIVRDLYKAIGPRLHGFGVKKTGLLAFHTYLLSADSMAWSFGARAEMNEIRLWNPEIEDLGSPQNDIETALDWREQLLRDLNPFPVRRFWAAGDIQMKNTQKQDGVEVLRLPGTAFQQGPHTLYSFAMDGKLLPLIAGVSRVRRDESGIVGYQRPEVSQHIKAIRKYVERPEAALTNSLVVAFDERTRFTPLQLDDNQDELLEGAGVRLGILEIPICPDDPSGWVVDGQQRMAAIRDAEVERFMINCVAFHGNMQQQRDQFILVNSTKNLPQALIEELVPETQSLLPPKHERNRNKLAIIRRLNDDEDSPLYQEIKWKTNPKGRISHRALLKALDHSTKEGILTQIHDPEAALRIFKDFWRAVSQTWPEEWKLPSTKSRLTHGAGIASLGAVMEEICQSTPGIPTVLDFRVGLALISDVCVWTDDAGVWPFGRRASEIQNTEQDIRLLTRTLVQEYRKRFWERAHAVMREPELAAV